jgi:hypothetical protein
MGALDDAKSKIQHVVDEVKDHLPSKKTDSEPSDFSQDIRHGGGETPGSSAIAPDDV